MPDYNLPWMHLDDIIEYLWHSIIITLEVVLLIAIIIGFIFLMKKIFTRSLWFGNLNRDK